MIRVEDWDNVKPERRFRPTFDDLVYPKPGGDRNDWHWEASREDVITLHPDAIDEFLSKGWVEEV